MNRRIAVALAGILLGMSMAAESKTIYKYVDPETGTVMFTDVPPRSMVNVHRQEVSRRSDASTRTDQLVARMRRLLTHYDTLYQDPTNMRVTSPAPSGSVTSIGPQITIARDGPEDPAVCSQLLRYQFGDIGLHGRRPWASEQRDVTYYRNRYGC
jgi:hypothetical protein